MLVPPDPWVAFLPLLETVRLAPGLSVLLSRRTAIMYPGKYLVVLSLVAFDGSCKGTTRRGTELVAIVRLRKLTRADAIRVGKLADPPPALPVVVETASFGIARY